MLRRAMYETLLAWKKSSDKKALLIDGARQIGKTFLIEEFARQEYGDYIKVDFLADDGAAAYFAEAKSAQQVIDGLTLISGKKAIPGNTLVFFDEVQEAQNLVTFSKYLVQDGRFDVVMSGSMLGVELKRVKSFPVGYLQKETMHPLTFEEFCWAQNVPARILDEVKSCLESKTPLEEAVHERLLALFRLYLVIGGMPEAVWEYVNSNRDLGAVRKVQSELVDLYREDIAKYAGDRVAHIKAIYEAMPAQLAKENKRFLFKTIRNDAKYERFSNDFTWLTSAKTALKATNVTDPRPMLEHSEEQARFKLYLADTGMLMAQYQPSVALAAIAGAKSVNFGSVYENAVAQELEAAGIPLHYHYSTRNGEVDFIAETAEGTVLPIEVKSGKDYKRHVALNNLLKNSGYGIRVAYVLSEGNVSTEEREGGTVHYLPLYMLSFIAQSIKGKGLQGVRIAPPEW